MNVLSHSTHDGGWLLTKVGLTADYFPTPLIFIFLDPLRQTVG